MRRETSMPRTNMVRRQEDFNFYVLTKSDADSFS
jgi:hypothetical protein